MGYQDIILTIFIVFAFAKHPSEKGAVESETISAQA